MHTDKRQLEDGNGRACLWHTHNAHVSKCKHIECMHMGVGGGMHMHMPQLAG